MDALDITALRRLMSDGRVSWADLARDLGLASTSAAERVHRLEESGVISGYAAIVDPAAVGADLTAFVAVSLTGSEHRDGFLAAIAGMDEIAECHHVAGDDDFLLKVRCAGTAGLERLVSDTIKGLEGIARTRTTVVLSSAKESVVVPLDDATTGP